MAARIDLCIVASFGGHLEEVLELQGAWQARDCCYVTTAQWLNSPVSPDRLEYVRDCHRNQFFPMLVCTVQTIAIMLRRRPACLVTTGALPGLIAATVARLLGAHVIWIDSVANADEPSGSARAARLIANDFVVQWPDLAARWRAQYLGNLL